MKVTLIVPTKTLDHRIDILLNTSEAFGYDLIIVEGRNPSFQRNEAVKRATGEIIYFVDNDSVVAKGNVEKALALFEANATVGIIGGPSLTPETDSLLQKTFGTALASPFATGKSAARYKSIGEMRETDEKEIILCNFFIRKSLFDELSGFNETLYPNEENEFMNRVAGLGYKIIYAPDITVNRSQRKTWELFLNQCFAYGKGRAEQIRVKFEKKDLVNLVPAVFVFYLLLLVGFIVVELSFDFVIALPLPIYLGLSLFSAFKAWLENKNIKIFMLLFFIFPIVHILYGCGLIFGFIFSKKKNLDKNIEFMRVPAGREF